MLASELEDVDDNNNDNNSKIDAVLWQTNLRTGGGGVGGIAPNGTIKTTITGIQH